MLYHAQIIGVASFFEPLVRNRLQGKATSLLEEEEADNADDNVEETPEEKRAPSHVRHHICEAELVLSDGCRIEEKRERFCRQGAWGSLTGSGNGIDKVEEPLRRNTDGHARLSDASREDSVKLWSVPMLGYRDR